MTSLHGLVPLVELYRGDTLENVHAGAVAVCDTGGRVLAAAGDPQRLCFTRSTLKALQALPFMEAGGAERFGLADPQLALLCASHSGEPMHVAQVQAVLDAAGATYRQLQCGCHVPYFTELGLPAGTYDERNHNCSGKHAGFLAACVQQGWPLVDYLDAGHPLQQAIRRAVARATGTGDDALRMGIDGCSAPNFALPLAGLARAYARLASGARDAEFGGSFEALSRAMRSHPELVSGTGRNDLAFMQGGRGDWVTKVGADGMQAVGSVSRGVGFAVKVADGNKAALHAVTVEVMDQLGWLDDAQREALAPWRSGEIASVRGAIVGQRRPAFRLQAA